MAEFEKAIPHTLKWEGGFVNHPADPGGATNRGITFNLFKQYAKSLGFMPTVDALKNMTEVQAKSIYKVHFWDKMRGLEFKDQSVANITFDAFVNCGYNGIKIVQRMAGTNDDGIIGPNSLTAINGANPKVLFDSIKEERVNYYKDLAERKPQMGVFLRGWLNRVDSFVYKNYEL